MFRDATSFNSDISQWDVSKGIDFVSTDILHLITIFSAMHMLLIIVLLIVIIHMSGEYVLCSHLVQQRHLTMGCVEVY